MSVKRDAFLDGYMSKLAGPFDQGVLGSFTPGFMQNKEQKRIRKIDNLYGDDQKESAKTWDAVCGKASPDREQFEVDYRRMYGQDAPTSYDQSKDMYQKTLQRRNMANDGRGAQPAPGILGYNDWQNRPTTKAYMQANPKADGVSVYNNELGKYNKQYGTQFSVIQDQKSYLARPDTQKYVQYLMQQTPGMTQEQAHEKAYQAGIQAHAAKYATPFQPTVQPTAQPTVQPTVKPTDQPTVQPTAQPTVQPTAQPTVQPTAQPVNGVRNRTPQQWLDYKKQIANKVNDAQSSYEMRQDLAKLEAYQKDQAYRAQLNQESTDRLNKSQMGRRKEFDDEQLRKAYENVGR